MKKVYMLAAGALVALSASAQYTLGEPWVNQTVVPGETQIFDVVLASETVITALQANGQKVNDIRVDDTTRFLYVWEGTMDGGDSSFPGVGYSDYQYDGYSSFVVNNVGWSGAGFFISQAANFNNKHWNDNTRMHLAYRTGGTAPESIAIIVNDAGGDTPGNSPAKVALGANFEDGGAIYTSIAPVATGDWQAIDISFADLKKFYNSFTLTTSDHYAGNIVSFLAGGVQGRDFSFDAIYMHTPADEGAVRGVEADSQFVVTRNTINATNAQSIELYDLSGRLIKSAQGTTLGISEIGSGIYVAKAGKSVTKIVK